MAGQRIDRGKPRATLGTRRPLGWPTILGYGFGDLGFNLYFTGLNLYLLYYYTDVLEIPPAVAGLIFMVPVVWDGISDPLMGWIATRTRTRLGAYRPWILLGGPLMGVSFVGMFAAPLWFPDHLVLASLIAHILFRTMYTVSSVPYSSLAAALTADSTERSTLAGFRMFCAMSGGLITAATMLELARVLGEGDLREGFVRVALLYAVIAAVAMTVVFGSTREETGGASHPRPSTRDSVRFMRHNSAFWILCIASLVGGVGTAMSGKALVYYLQYEVGRPDVISTVLGLGLVGAACGVPIWTAIARRVSKRNLWIFGSLCAACVNVAFLTFRFTDVTVIAVLGFATGVMASSVAVMFWSMLPDTVEFGEWKTGVRDEGMVFGLIQLVGKAGSGIGVGLLGVLLGWVGYVAGSEQSEASLFGIRMLSFAVPLATGLTAAALIWFYPLDARLHGRLVTALQRRRQRTTGNRSG